MGGFLSYLPFKVRAYAFVRMRFMCWWRGDVGYIYARLEEMRVGNWQCLVIYSERSLLYVLGMIYETKCLRLENIGHHRRV